MKLILVVSGKLDQVPIGVPDIHRGDGPMRAGPFDRTHMVDMMLMKRGGHIIQRILYKQTQVSRARRRLVRLGINLMAGLTNVDLLLAEFQRQPPIAERPPDAGSQGA